MYFVGNVCLVKDVELSPQINSWGGKGCHLQPNEWKRDEPKDCIELCQNVPGCTHFNWISPEHEWIPGRLRCCLKIGESRTRKEKEGVTSGYASSSCGSKSSIRGVLDVYHLRLSYLDGRN